MSHGAPAHPAHVKKCHWRAAVLAGVALWGWPAGARAQHPYIVIEEMTFVSSRGDSNELVLRARRADIDTLEQIAHLQMIRAEIPDADGAQGFEMTCDRGELHLDSNDFRAEGNVTGRTASGRQFETLWVRYDHAAGLLSTDAEVTVREGGTTLRGVGFRYYVHERRFRLLGGASLVQE